MFRCELDRFWLYNGNALEKGPRPISEYGLSQELANMDAVFVWGRNQRTYFFKGDKYWRYDDKKHRIDYGYPRNISVWKGVPSNIDAAMRWRNGRSYFFKGREYLKLDDWKIETEKGYPRRIALKWMGCDSENLDQPTNQILLRSRERANATDPWHPTTASTAQVFLPGVKTFAFYTICLLWLL